MTRTAILQRVYHHIIPEGVLAVDEKDRCWLMVAQYTRCSFKATSDIGLCRRCVDLLRSEEHREWMDDCVITRGSG